MAYNPEFLNQYPLLRTHPSWMNNDVEPINTPMAPNMLGTYVPPSYISAAPVSAVYGPGPSTSHRTPHPRDSDVFRNYAGDRTNSVNRGADIPNTQSTSLWIEGLPGYCTVSQLLASIEGVGKVFSVHMNPPTKHIPTSAAKLVFWNRRGVEELFKRAREGEFTVGGLKPKVVPHRIKVAAQPDSPCSRVIHVSGPGRVVNERYLMNIFETRFEYTMDEVIISSHKDEYTSLEIRFGSYRAQAAAAWRLLKELRDGRVPDDFTFPVSSPEVPLLKEMELRWGKDPCEES